MVYCQAGWGCGVAEPAGEAGLRDEGVLQDDRYDPAGTQDIFLLGFASTNPKNPRLGDRVLGEEGDVFNFRVCKYKP